VIIHKTKIKYKKCPHPSQKILAITQKQGTVDAQYFRQAHSQVENANLQTKAALVWV
jgi:hypothetical protein